MDIKLKQDGCDRAVYVEPLLMNFGTWSWWIMQFSDSGIEDRGLEMPQQVPIFTAIHG